MHVLPADHHPTPGPLLLAAALACGAAGPAPLDGQQPSPQTPPPVALPYRAPVIALVQPPEGVSVPHDRPVVVLRFASGEASDPLDLTTFRVVVDGVDRTGLFTVGAVEAWGPLAPIGPEEDAGAIAAGAHQIDARVCSARGACAAISVPVSVLATPGSTDSTAVSGASRPSRRQRLLDLVLEAARRLLTP
jgi:hypothetical protein